MSKFGFEFGVDFSKEHSAKAVLGDKHVIMGRHVFFVPKDEVGARVPVHVCSCACVRAVL